MGAQDSVLVRGIAAARAGDKSLARQLLSQAVQLDPGAEMGWLWLSAVLNTPQARAFCMQKILDVNPTHRIARQALVALEKAAPAPVLVAMPLAAVYPSRPSPKGQARARAALIRQPAFWKRVVLVLGVVAFGLSAMLAYAMFHASRAAETGSLAAIVPERAMAPRGTLRPTFTATSTATDTPRPTSTPMPTWTLTPAPTPTDTPVPTATPTRRTVQRAAAVTRAPTPTSRPRPTLPPCAMDPRLGPLGVRVEPAAVLPGEPYWRLVEARWADERESAGKHSIFIEVLDLQGRRAVGQVVEVQWVGGSVALPIQDRPPPDWGADFAMYNTLGSYSVRVAGAPSDRIVGLGLGTAETPHFTVHTSFYLTFRRVSW